MIAGGVGGRFLFPLTVALLLLALGMVVVYFEPPLVLFGDDPMSGRDLDTHVEQVWRVTEALDGWGKSWAYDPQMLAGQPAGAEGLDQVEFLLGGVEQCGFGAL